LHELAPEGFPLNHNGTLSAKAFVVLLALATGGCVKLNRTSADFLIGCWSENSLAKGKFDNGIRSELRVSIRDSDASVLIGRLDESMDGAPLRSTELTFARNGEWLEKQQVLELADGTSALSGPLRMNRISDPQLAIIPFGRDAGWDRNHADEALRGKAWIAFHSADRGLESALIAYGSRRSLTISEWSLGPFDGVQFKTDFDRKVCPPNHSR
jgi:hypothetical protein